MNNHVSHIDIILNTVAIFSVSMVCLLYFLDIILTFSVRDRLQMSESESDVYRCRILTSEVDPAPKEYNIHNGRRPILT